MARFLNSFICVPHLNLQFAEYQQWTNLFLLYKSYSHVVEHEFFLIDVLQRPILPARKASLNILANADNLTHIMKTGCPPKLPHDLCVIWRRLCDNNLLS